MATRQNRAMNQMVSHLLNLDQLVGKSTRQSLTRGLLIIRNEQTRQAKILSGGNMVLSGVGRNGAKVGASYKATKDTFGIVRATGPWTIRDSSVSGGPVRPHLITSRYGGGSRASRARRLGGTARTRRTEAFLGIGPSYGKGRGVGGAINIFGENRKESKGWRLYARHPGAPRRPYWVQGINTVTPSLGKVIHANWVTKNLMRVYG